jgi:hypothetical protein
MIVLHNINTIKHDYCQYHYMYYLLISPPLNPNSGGHNQVIIQILSNPAQVLHLFLENTELSLCLF